MGAPLLIDVGAVPAEACTDCLESLFKAIAEDPTGDGDRTIWAPHDNPWLAAHVEAVTGRMQRLLEAIQDLFAQLLTGGEPMDLLQKAMPPWYRWSEVDFDDARRRLESIPPGHYTLADWMLMVDFLIQRYLPPGVIDGEAEYLAVRAQILGKIQANMEARGAAPSPAEIGAMVELVPTEFRKVPPRILSPVERQTLAVAQARAAIGISDIADSARARMKKLIVQHVQGQILGQSDAQGLRQALFDGFGQLNRDFRRIAVTEAGECCNQGFIAAASGRRVKRMEAYRGACDFCRSINGKVFRVVEPTDPKKNGDTDVWLGKTNLGRSAAPRKRLGAMLVEREVHERWWPAAGVQHPHCRGSWVLMPSEKPPAVRQEFEDYLDGLLAQGRPKAPAS